MSKTFIGIIVIFLALVITPIVLAETNISDCMELNVSDTYILNQSVSADGTCFTITADNVTLDCQGNWITYSTSGTNYTYGIYTDRFNTTIKNCNVLDGNWSSNNLFIYGIYLYGSKNSSLHNNFVNVNNTIAISIENNAEFNNVTNNTGLSDSSIGIYVQLSANNTLTNNIGTSNSGIGIYIYQSSNNTLTSNIGTSNSSIGIYLENVSNNILTNNNGTSNTSRGIYLYTSSNNTLIDNKGTSDSDAGIYLSSSNNNLLTSNNGTSNSSYGIYLTLSSNNNLTGNTGTSNTLSGIRLYSSTNNILTNNNGTSNTHVGIYLESSSNNTLTNNIGTSNTTMGIYLTSSSNNILTGNTGTSKINSGIEFYASSDNVLTGNNATGEYGYYIRSSNYTSISDCIQTFGSNYDIQVSSENYSIGNLFINCSYNISKEIVDGTGNYIIRQWYFEVNITNSSGDTVNVANITIYNSTGGIIYSGLTNASGNINRTTITEYVNKGGTRTYSTPHTINVTKTGYNTSSTTTNISTTTNTKANIQLIETVDTSSPIVTIISPINGLYTNTSVLLNISINSSKNIASCYYLLDGQNYTINNCNYTAINFTDGVKILRIYANDTLGISGYSDVRFIVDTTNNTLVINSSSISLDNYSNTEVFVPSNVTLTQVHIAPDIADTNPVKIYFINVSSNESQSTIRLNNSINITRNTTTATYNLQLPDNLTIIGPSNWTGEIILPTVMTISTVSITPSDGMTVSISKVIEIGYGDRLNLSSAARIVFSGEAGKIVGYDEGSGVVRIINICPNSTNQSIIDANLTESNLECVMTSGNDIILWSKHFSKFVTFTESAIPSANNENSGSSGSTSGSGGGGPGLYPVNISFETKNISDTVVVNRYWPTLINGTRNIDINENGMPLIYTSININTNANVANTLKITAQLKNPTNNTINATIYKYITFNTTIGNEFIDNITLKFEVSKSWIKQNNMTASNVTLYIYDAGWSKANITKYSEDNEYVYYSTTIAKFNSLAIGVPIIITEPVKKDIIPPTPNETISTVKNDTNNVTNSITTMDDQSFFNKFKKIEDVLINARDKALGYVTNLNIPKETKYLIIITLSSILTLLLGVITGVLVYKNTLKHKKRVRQKPKTKDNIIVNKMMTGRIMPYTEEPPINNTPPTVTSPLVIKAGEKPPEVVQAQISDSEYYVRKISELILQCEYAIDNGKIEDAKKYYEEAKTLYFNSDLDYEHKSKVSDKILALRNKLK